MYDVRAIAIGALAGVLVCVVFDALRAGRTDKAGPTLRPGRRGSMAPWSLWW